MLYHCAVWGRGQDLHSFHSRTQIEYGDQFLSCQNGSHSLVNIGALTRKIEYECENLRYVVIAGWVSSSWPCLYRCFYPTAEFTECSRTHLIGYLHDSPMMTVLAWLPPGSSFMIKIKYCWCFKPLSLECLLFSCSHWNRSFCEVQDISISFLLPVYVGYFYSVHSY